MRADAGTHIIIAHAHQSQRVRGLIGQALQADLGRHFVAGDKFVRDGQMGVYHLVYTACNLFHLLGRGLCRQLIVYLTLLAFYVCVVGTLASEHPHHRLVQNVLGSVHGRVFRLIVVV